MIIESYSWKVLSDAVAIKEIDKTIFNDNLTAIPVKVRAFFGVEAGGKGLNHPVTFLYKRRNHNAKIYGISTPTPRIRIQWGNDFKEVLVSTFGQLAREFISKESTPSGKGIIRFKKKALGTFEIDLINNESLDNDLQNENYQLESLIEGKVNFTLKKTYERNPRLRKMVLAFHGYKCSICGFDFEEAYGTEGKHYIEVHHIEPLSKSATEIEVDPEKDLTTVCANCHRIIHRRKTAMTIKEIKQSLNVNYARHWVTKD